MERVIGGKFKLGKKIGCGSFGELHLGLLYSLFFSTAEFGSGVNIQSGEEVAIKLVYIIDYGLAKKYRDFQTHKHIPYRMCCDIFYKYTSNFMFLVHVVLIKHFGNLSIPFTYISLCCVGHQFDYIFDWTILKHPQIGANTRTRVRD
ncbi:hypothetical protein B296_00023202 [Ensete ventricosum]|uniref:Non-specific serine/threonine protein kinase n=1 Tax=Ensete ventricosum TaxID=4639 RepID=A0A426YEZ5_ENSVE|nr:hypothetical protein B296_00023202 [Ensete ventricosum]